MYESHPSFELPADLNMQIWRYMDFTKFVAMLESDSLWFARADCLRDPFEAAYTKPMVEKYYAAKGETKEEEKDSKAFNALFLNLAKQRLTSFYVNCWHINSCESAAMWELYLKSDEGLAIQSTISRLIESANKSRETILIGKVRYIDYNNASFDETNIYNQILHKRKSYEHENELRAVLVPELDFESGDFESGLVFCKVVAAGVKIGKTGDCSKDTGLSHHAALALCRILVV